MPIDPDAILPEVKAGETYRDQNDFVFKVTDVTDENIDAEVFNTQDEKLMDVTMKLQKAQVRIARGRWTAI